MSVPTWLEMARADAARRGLDEVVPLLEGLGTTMAALQAAAQSPDLVSLDAPPREAERGDAPGFGTHDPGPQTQDPGPEDR